jgi:hypothetical protein
MPASTAKLDANESMFLENELRHVETKLWERRIPPLMARVLFPVSFEIDEGAESYEWRSADAVGVARIISNAADDAPMVDAFETPHTSTIRSIGDGFRYSTQDIRAAMKANKPLQERKRVQASKAIKLRENKIAFEGSKKDQIKGIFDTPNASIVTAAAAAASPNGIAWSAASGKTPNEIINDMFNLVDTPNNATGGVEKVDTLVLPIAAYNYISSTQKAAGTDTTILEFFRRVRPGVTVMSAVEMNSVTNLPSGSATPTTVAMAYTRSDEHLRLQVPMEERQLPPQAENFSYKVLIEARTGGVVVYLPLSIAFMEGI